MTAVDVNTTAHSVTARKAHLCHDCARLIDPGEVYARLVAFPAADFYNGTVPWVVKLCERCQTQYGRRMPPSRSKGVRR